MSIPENTFFKATEFNKQVIKIIENLLKSYPLTKKLTGIIGKSLLNNIELGFFNSGYEIIKQGDTGRDVYFHCNNEIDVLVNGQTICTMQAPALIGDKGLIDQNSVRSASIAVSEDNTCLFLKIPMDLFLRSYKDTTIPDSAFSQEKDIYYHIFTEIQQRLFNYAFLQRQIWEEVSLLLNKLNTQLIIGIFEKKKEANWNDETWSVLKLFLEKNYKFSWPDEMPIDPGNYRDILYKILDKVFPASKFPGQEKVYQTKKQLLWVKWLRKISSLVIKTLPNEQLPVNIGGIGLFDPRNYQGRVQAVLSSIEKRFMFKKVKLKEKETHVESLKVKNFFGKEIDSNQFNLNEYLSVFENLFDLKRPNRLLAQVAQQAGRVTAKSENEFNDSVSRMRQFIARVQNLSIADEKSTEDLDKKDAFLQSIESLNAGQKSYNKKIIGMANNYIGETRYLDKLTPTINDIIRSVSIQQLRTNLTKSLHQTISNFDLTHTGVSKATFEKFLYVSQSISGDIIPKQEIDKHYWIPISSTTEFYLNDEKCGEIEPGTILGGGSWELITTAEEGEPIDDYFLKTPKVLPGDANYEFLYYVIPKHLHLWHKENDVFETNFEKIALPLALWLIDKLIKQLNSQVEKCKTLYKQYVKVVEVLTIESRIREFENSQDIIPARSQQKINLMTNSSVGITFPLKKDLTSEKLSKYLYITILKQTKRFQSNLSIEEQNNKAYTLWRFVQSQIIQFIPQKPQVKPEPPEVLSSDVIQQLHKVFKNHGFSFNLENSKQKSIPEINLLETLAQRVDCDNTQALSFIDDILKILEIENYSQISSIMSYKKQLSDIENVNLDINVDQLQSDYIIDSIGQLQIIVEEHFDAETAKPSD